MRMRPPHLGQSDTRGWEARADLVARGMDFVGVRAVVNYDFPQSPVEYVHRVGRTGRAGRSGEAVTLYTDSDAGGAWGSSCSCGGLC